MLARRFLLGGHGSTLPVDEDDDVGYTMSAAEVRRWRDLAALLDPDAYVYTYANNSAETVPTGQRWYLVNGWHLKATGAGTTWLHRPADHRQAMLLPEGFVIETGAPPDGSSTAFKYLCKPALVAEDTGDDRYADYQDDPRGLYEERMDRLATLTHHRIGATNGADSSTDVAFPTDFTDGLVVHVSSHDINWTTIVTPGTNGGLNTLNETGDVAGFPIRFSEPVIFPFKRTTFTHGRFNGSGDTEGRGTIHFCKLPSDW